MSSSLFFETLPKRRARVTASRERTFKNDPAAKKLNETNRDETGHGARPVETSRLQGNEKFGKTNYRNEQLTFVNATSLRLCKYQHIILFQFLQLF